MNMLFVICWIILFPLHFNNHDDNICWQQHMTVSSECILMFINGCYIYMRKLRFCLSHLKKWYCITVMKCVSLGDLPPSSDCWWKRLSVTQLSVCYLLQ